MKATIARWLIVMQLLICMAPAPALAQVAPSTGDIGAIAAAAKKPDDKSRQALVTIFGQVVNDPLATSNTVGGGDTILAVIFQKLNVILLSIAGVLVGYGVFRRVANTARTGTVLDQAGNSFWGPLRMVWGLSSLVPTANGWSIAQLVMLWAASVMGIGSANIAVDTAAQALKAGTPLVAQPVMPQTLSVARQLFQADLCMQGINYSLARVARDGGLVDQGEYVQQVPLQDGSGFKLINGARTYSCGGATIDTAHLSPEYKTTGLFDTSTFNVSQVYRAQRDALIRMQDTLRPAAKAYVAALLKKQAGQSTRLPDPEVIIQSAAGTYENTVQAQVGQVDGEMHQLTGKIVDNLATQGWWMLGSWYQTFAQANTRLNSAVGALATVQTPSPIGYSGPDGAWRLAKAAYQTAEANSTAAGPIGTPGTSASIAASTGGGVSGLLKKLFSSPGQRLVNYITSRGVNNGQVNPLIHLKNVGDYTMGLAETIMTSVIGLQVADQMLKGWSWEGAVAKVGNALTGAGDAFDGALKGIYPYLFLVILALFGFGLTLSIYLPLIPFVTWFAGILNWLAVVAEGVVAASLWSLAHLLGEGEGMGQQATHGYIYLLHMITRPLLMVISFFIAGTMLIPAGSMLVDGFGVAVANVQFDSITGIFSILGFFWVYTQLCLTLVHMCFNLVLWLPDRVIAWVGGAMPTQFAMDTHDKVHAGFHQGRDRLTHTHERGGDRAQGALRTPPRTPSSLPGSGNGATGG